MRAHGAACAARPGPALSATVLMLLLALLTGCTSAPEPEATGHWRPEPGIGWQWQLSGRLDLTVDVPVYDIDGFENEASAVADLHRRDRKVICYISTGAWEEFRPDAGKFPASVLGKATAGRGSGGSTSAARTSWNR